MKTETEIAKENVEKKRRDILSYYEGITHLQSCQRFLEFLEIHKKDQDTIKWVDQFTLEKITDLQNAIKIYKEVGIE